MNHEDLLVRPDRPIQLAELDPKFTCEFTGKSDARDKLERDIERLAQLQEVFYAAGTHALLIVLQGMDASGKDGAIKHVMSGINPQGVRVYSFKPPSLEESRHDFLWRCEKMLPERGRIAIFNRSYYEEVVVVRVHEELLGNEGVTPNSTGDALWSDRFEDINAFEMHLARSGTVVVKFFLHISQDEQRSRLLERLDDPEKTWKFSADDVRERQYWERYLWAYEQAINHTSTAWAPWCVIPSNHKWFTRTAIADVLVAKLKSLGLRYPELDRARSAALAAVLVELEADSARAKGGV